MTKQEIQSLYEELKQAHDTLQNQYHELELKISEQEHLSEAIDAKDTLILDLEDKLKKSQEVCFELKTAYEENLNTLKLYYSKDIGTLKEMYEKDLQDLKATYEENLGTLNEKNCQEVEELESKHKSVIKQLNETTADEIDKLKKHNEEEVLNLVERFTKEKENLQKTIAQSQEQYNIEKTNLESTYQASITQIETKFKKRSDQLALIVETLSNTLKTMQGSVDNAILLHDRILGEFNKAGS